MRTFIIVVCSLALACSAGAAQNDNKSKKQAQKNRPTQSVQRTATAAAPKRATPKRSQQNAAQNAQASRYATSANYSKKTKQWKGNTASAAAFQSNDKKYKAQRFNLASNTRPTKYTAVKFQQNRRIQGSQYWQGKNYWAFRNYRPSWHDRGWWHSHYNRVVFAYGGWYYWNSGWWYPAWGYAPNSYY